MAIIPRDTRRAAALTAGTVSASMLGQMLANPQVRTVVRQLADGLRQQKGNGGGAKPGKRKKGRGGGDRNEFAVTNVPGPISTIVRSGHDKSTRLRTRITWLEAIATNASGVNTGVIRIATDDNSQPSLGSNNAKLGSLRDMYRYVQFKRVKWSFIPALSFNASGAVALGVDSDTMVASITGVTDVSTKEFCAVGSILRPLSITWTPSGVREKMEKRTRVATTGGVTSVQDDTAASSLVFAATSSVVSALVGYFYYEVDVEFSDLK